MVDRTPTLVSRIEQIINIASFIESFSDLFIVDQDNKVISIKSSGNINYEHLISVFKQTREDFFKFKIPFLCETINGFRFISYYFRSRNSELALIGINRNEELFLGDLSTFKLLVMNIKDIFDTVETTASVISEFREVESILSFYKSITAPLNRELFLAYIIDNIIAELGAEVGSIVILDKNYDIISGFYLGLEESITKKLIVKAIQIGHLEEPVIASANDKQELLSQDDKKLENLIIYPIRFEKEVVGAVILANKRLGIDYKPFNENDVSKLKILINPVGVVVKNYVMYKELFFLNQLSNKILLNITSIIAITGDDGRIKYINKTELKELVEDIIKSIKEKDAQKLQSVGVEVEVKNSFYEVKAQPIYEETGSVSEILWTIEDVTYKKEITKRYVLSEKMNVISEIVSGIAHEIRNPLTSISGFIELLKSRKDDQKFIDKFIEVTSKDIERIINLLNSFIRFSRPINYEISEVSLKSLVNESIDVLLYQINQKHIKVINKLDDNAVVKANYSLLLQVFTNIILNSIQAIEHKSGIIEIGYSEYFDNNTNYLAVYVKDNGVGIPKEIQDRIFDPFFTTKPKGTGLGLSICQKIVMDHGGFIKVKSEEGEGTTVMIFIPIERVASGSLK
ncbi:MAG: ATP-binding protein [Spirochaetia bacterium]|nr:ATP-binding protein [Spirochaetota bacterium]MCX8096449.1 ATP-binding protein [Spirochaetota bacterium]MDW8112747.1 ATP-binding protein [Spirochaetia bacterium]